MQGRQPIHGLVVHNGRESTLCRLHDLHPIARSMQILHADDFPQNAGVACPNRSVGRSKPMRDAVEPTSTRKMPCTPEAESKHPAAPDYPDQRPFYTPLSPGLGDQDSHRHANWAFQVPIDVEESRIAGSLIGCACGRGNQRLRLACKGVMIFRWFPQNSLKGRKRSRQLESFHAMCSFSRSAPELDARAQQLTIFESSLSLVASCGSCSFASATPFLVRLQVRPQPRLKRWRMHLPNACRYQCLDYESVSRSACERPWP